MRSGRTVWLVVSCAILLATGFVLFASAGRDDAHLSYWPAHTLAHIGQITNYSGDRVEQSSSLLHVVSLAAIARLTGTDPVTFGKAFSAFFGAATIVGLFVLVQRIASQRAALAATFIASTSPYLLYWSYGGLETTLAACLGDRPHRHTGGLRWRLDSWLAAKGIRCRDLF
jgi:hypothetical protein